MPTYKKRSEFSHDNLLKLALESQFLQKDAEGNSKITSVNIKNIATLKKEKVDCCGCRGLSWSSSTAACKRQCPKKNRKLDSHLPPPPQSRISEVFDRGEGRPLWLNLKVDHGPHDESQFQSSQRLD